MTKTSLLHSDVRTYRTHEKFHALFCDPPYHLTSITKRFGKEGSVPAQYGKDGAFSRASKGFMGKQWDGGDIAFDPRTWHHLGHFLYPGAFGMCFASARGWHRLACAIEDAGFIIHPSIFLWVYGSGFPKATRIDTQIQKAEDQAIVGEKLLWGHNAGTGAGSFSKNQYEGQTGIQRTIPITCLNSFSGSTDFESRSIPYTIQVKKRS